MTDHLRPPLIRWQTLLKAQFRATPSHEIYILGCFARHLTLYSQQVRALNLIYGLWKTEKLKKGQKVAVIGGGAAGLTAAAAAAYRGARVTIFDELAGPMELQQNNRQRWIHPFIYDWPYLDDSLFEQFKEGEANLPLLTWSADYAANVARQISSQWDSMQNAYDIHSHWCVRDLTIRRRRSGTIHLSWDRNERDDFALVVLAVGFGLEPKKHGQDSYWTEDDLDGGFRRPVRRQKWLLSGAGDGGFTDLMRLSIHRFRQDEILNLFVTAQGIDGLKRDLRALHSTTTRADHRQISKQFEAISIDNELRNLLREQVRPDGPEVVFITKKHPLFGPGTSVLNRLVIRILSELRPRVFECETGRVSKVRPWSNQFRVKIRKRNRSSFKRFDRVLLRHGPKPNMKRDFPSVYRSCKSLESVWKNLRVNDDVTRRPAWPPRFFGPGVAFRGTNAEKSLGTAAGKRFRTQDPNFEKSVKRFGLWAEALTIVRHVRSDGSSSVTYEVDGLSLLRGRLDGIHFLYRSGAGKVDRVRLEAPRGSGLKWINQTARKSVDNGRIASSKLLLRAPTDSDPIARVRERVRVLSGTVRFKKSLTALSPPLSFRLNFRLLNGDALSAWEFKQMYGPELQKHADNKRLKHPIEYLARIVWFPVRTLRIRVTLPTNIKNCAPSVFLLRNQDAIAREHVVKNGILLRSRPKRWMKAVAKPLLPPHDMGMFQKVAAHSWALSVPQPLVGSCYSLDWTLPSTPENTYTKNLEKQAHHFRQVLLRYRRASASTQTVNHSVHKHRYELAHQALLDLYRSLSGEAKSTSDNLELILMTYSQKLRLLWLVDGVRNGKHLGTSARNFWLPFGLGMAGSCFKSGNRIFLMNRARKTKGVGPQPWLDASNRTESDQGFYLRIPPRKHHKFLLQIPVDHPSYKSEACPEGYQPSRQCVGIVGIASEKGDTWLSKITKTEDFKIVQRWCQGFCNELHKILVPDELHE